MSPADSEHEGTRVEIEIVTDTYKIRGTVFVPFTGQAAYSYVSRLSDLLNNPDR